MMGYLYRQHTAVDSDFMMGYLYRQHTAVDKHVYTLVTVHLNKPPTVLHHYVTLFSSLTTYNVTIYMHKVQLIQR